MQQHCICLRCGKCQVSSPASSAKGSQVDADGKRIYSDETLESHCLSEHRMGQYSSSIFQRKLSGRVHPCHLHLKALAVDSDGKECSLWLSWNRRHLVPLEHKASSYKEGILLKETCVVARSLCYVLRWFLMVPCYSQDFKQGATAWEPSSW